MEFALSLVCTIIFFLVLLTTVGAIGAYVHEKYAKTMPMYAHVALVILCVACSVGAFFIFKALIGWLLGSSDSAPTV